MITGLDQMNPGMRPELELGYAAMRRKEIEDRLVEYAKQGKIDFQPGALTKNELVTLANGLVAQGKIPPLSMAPVDPRKKEMDDLKAQIEDMRKMLSAQAAPPPVLSVVPTVAEEPAPIRRPGRPKKED